MTASRPRRLPSSQHAIHVLTHAFLSGRPIVPFLGAGVSAGSGFPLTETIREYLCKAKFFIRYSVYRRLLGQDIPQHSALSANDLEFNPSRYLLQFGWPDFNRLTADLWRYADRPFSRPPHYPDAPPWWLDLRRTPALGDADKMLRDRFAPETEYLDRCFELFGPAVHNASGTGDVHDPEAARLAAFREVAGYDAFAERTCAGKPIWGWRRNRLTSIVEFVLLELLKVEDLERTKQIEKTVWDQRLRIRGDWFKLLHDLVEGRRGLADELLAQLNRHRSPSLAHLMLAHLAKRLGWRLLLTLNHDSLIEKAFSSEGLNPKVFDVNALAGVPDPALLRREPLSIVKLHGSAFGLRLGESTNDELDDTTRERLLSYIPQNAVLLVIGFSGYERRMMSLIESIASEIDPASNDSRQLVWMYWGTPEEPVNRLRDRLRHADRPGGNTVTSRHAGAPIELFQLEDAGTFLKGLYQRLTRTLPSTRIQYRSLPKRITAGTGRSPFPSRQETVQLFVRDSLISGHSPGRSAIPISAISPRPPSPPFRGLVKRELSRATYLSTAMSHFVGTCKGYDTIWVDLEDHHTVTGVVTEIISQLRIFDPTLPPLVLPVATPSLPSATARPSTETPHFDRPARYLQRAIRRGRYVFAFGSTEGFGRPHTAHHGLTSLSSKTLAGLDSLFMQFCRTHLPFTGKPTSKCSVGNEALFERLLADYYRAHRNEELFNGELHHYARLVDLLDFFCLLLGTQPYPPNERQNDCRTLADRGLTPHVVDWHCCFAIDVPQPRHLKAGPGSSTGIADLTFYALSRFCTELTSALGCKEYLPNGVPIHLATPPREFLEAPQVGLTRIKLPQAESEHKLQVPDGDWLNRLCVHLAELDEHPNTDVDLINAVHHQTFIDEIIIYTVDRLASASGTHYGDPHAEASPQTLDKDAVALYMLMSSFRRPRNIASLNALVERLQAMLAGCTDAEMVRSGTVLPFDVDRLLERLIAVNLVYLSEGELYFIPEHVHQISYKLLSAPLRLTQWRQLAEETWKEQAQNDYSWLVEGSDCSAALLRGAWLGRLHSAVGRDYYLHNWQRSKDAGALFEYLYHRLSSLRYLMLLRTRCWIDNRLAPRLKASGGKRPGANLLRMRCLLGKTGNDWGGELSWEFLRERTDVIRSEYIGALINVIERERSAVLTSAAGHTWLHWVWQMFYVDFGEIFGRPDDVSDTQRFPVEMFAQAWRTDAHSSDTRTGVSFKTLRLRSEILLLDMYGVLNREIGAFKECVSSRVSLLANVFLASRNIGRSDQDPVGALLHAVRSALAAEPDILQGLVEALSERIGEFGSVRRLVHLIDGAVVDIAAAKRHDGIGAHDVAEDVLKTFIERAETLDKHLSRTNLKNPFGQAVAQEARAALKVAVLHWEFELYRLNADVITRRRFEIVDCLGRPSVSWRQGKAPSDYLQLIHRTERQLYGVPFEHEGDFVLQVSRCAALRATLLSMLPSLDALVESLRLFEEAESGLAPEHPAHMFHQVIIHTQRAYTLMLIADAEVRRCRLPVSSRLQSVGWAAIDVAETNQGNTRVLSYEEYRDTVVTTALRSSGQRLAEARAELARAEGILGNGRRNVRVWLRLYHARAQLAIEEVLRLCLSVEFDAASLGNEHSFVAEMQEWSLFGLEAIRGAMDCTSYVETEREDSAVAIKLYLQLFVAGRITLQGYAAGRTEGRSALTMWQSVSSSKRLTGRQEYLERWEALNESVGLSRVYHILSDAGLNSEPEPIPAAVPLLKKSISWHDILELIDSHEIGTSSNNGTERAETLRECALQKMVALFNGRPPPELIDAEKRDRGGSIPWAIDRILEQRLARFPLPS